MLPSTTIACPYCGETIELLVDDSAGNDLDGSQQYVEDCQVCCRPIEVTVVLEDGVPLVRVAADSD